MSAYYLSIFQMKRHKIFNICLPDYKILEGITATIDEYTETYFDKSSIMNKNLRAI